MLETFFVTLFELLHGNQNNPAFRESVYFPAGVWLLLLTSVTVIFYYYVLNVVWARYSKTWPHWTIVAISSVLLNCVAVLLVERAVPDLALLSPGSVSLLLVDALYAFVAFFLLSMIAKWPSPNARRTPF
jgi:hypothetical protein